MRTLTLVVKIKDAETAKWIWENHMGNPSHGIKVETIAEGDQIKALEREIDSLTMRVEGLDY